MRITRIGLSMFLIETASGKKLLTDPWIAGNPTIPRSVSTPDLFRSLDAVVVSHGHFDHASGVRTITTANPDVQVFCPFELAFLMKAKGIGNVHPMNLGGTAHLGDIAVTLVPASHSSTYERERIYAGPATGVIITTESGYRLYFAGDTGLTAEFGVIGAYWRPDLAILPCGGRLTMDPHQAAYAAGELLRISRVIPCHYFPSVEAAPDPAGMAAIIEAQPFISEMIDKGEEFAGIMRAKYPTISVSVLELGDALEVLES